MYLTLIFFVFFAILIVLPIAQSLRKNIKIFLSFLLAFTSVSVFRLLFGLNEGNFLTKVATHILPYTRDYLSMMLPTEESKIQLIRFFLLFALFFFLFFLFLLILKYIIKEQSPFQSKTPIRFIAIKNIFAFVNILFIGAALSFACSAFNVLWQFPAGFLSRYFTFIESVVMNL